jgi:hypothetical protein
MKKHMIQYDFTLFDMGPVEVEIVNSQHTKQVYEVSMLDFYNLLCLSAGLSPECSHDIVPVTMSVSLMGELSDVAVSIKMDMGLQQTKTSNIMTTKEEIKTENEIIDMGQVFASAADTTEVYRLPLSISSHVFEVWSAVKTNFKGMCLVNDNGTNYGFHMEPSTVLSFYYDWYNTHIRRKCRNEDEDAIQFTIAPKKVTIDDIKKDGYYITSGEINEINSVLCDTYPSKPYIFNGTNKQTETVKMSIIYNVSKKKRTDKQNFQKHNRVTLRVFGYAVYF